MKKSRSGFTIVELLVVIVVIAILAAITIVAYNGIQQRARTAQTQQALTSWIKALELYKADNGKWPGYYTCLGDNYGYGSTGTGSSGYQCRQNTSTDGATVNSAFNTAMQAYISSRPTPAMVTGVSSSTLWYRGLSYLFGGGDGTAVYIMATYDGTTACPDAAGFSGSGGTIGGNRVCTYLLGLTTDS
jgi:prepilin-type N-terminal cleavage/methylation domain-containing protein